VQCVGEMKRKRGGELWVSSHGRIQNVDGLRYFTTPNWLGYSTVSIGMKKLSVHRVVHVLFNDPNLDDWFPKAQVDHIDRTRSNNHNENLRWADSTLQSSNRTMAGRSNKRAAGVTAWHVETDVVTRHADTKEAAEHTGVHATNITHCLAGRQMSAKGYVFYRYIKNKVIEGEEWRPVEGGYQVSSAGRIMTPTGVAYFPEGKEDGYRHVMIDYVPRSVHILVLSAWEERPSDHHTVDHINQIKSDNRLENLRWATSKEQRQNQTRKPERITNVWECRRVGDKEWQIAGSTYDACRMTGAKVSEIAHCASPKSRHKTTPGNDGIRYEFRKYKDPDQEDIEGEVWKVVCASEWAEGGKYARVMGFK